MSASPSAAIAFDGLRVVYGAKVAADVSFQVARNSIHGLIGSNGAGKTTALECLVGLRRPTAGSAWLLGTSPPPPEVFDRVGVYLQERGALPSRLRVAEVMGLYTAQLTNPREPSEVLQAVGLHGRDSAFYRSLSGGQRGRLHVALALLGRPEVLVLDEPTSGLDPEARHMLWQLLDQEQRHGATILITTHLFEEAERLCDRVTILHDGSVVADGAPAALLANHRFGFVLRFAAPGDWQPPPGVGQWWGHERDAALLVVADDVERELCTAHIVAIAGTRTAVTQRPAGLEELYLALTGHLTRVAPVGATE